MPVTFRSEGSSSKRKLSVCSFACTIVISLLIFGTPGCAKHVASPAASSTTQASNGQLPSFNIGTSSTNNQSSSGASSSTADLPTSVGGSLADPIMQTTPIAGDGAPTTYTDTNPNGNGMPSSASPDQQPDIQATSVALNCNTNVCTCSGDATNLTGQTMNDVEVKLIVMDANGQPIHSSDAMLDENPIMPDQTSTFQVSAQAATGKLKAKLKFHYLNGTVISSAMSAAPLATQ